MRISDWSSDVCSSDLLLVSFPFGLGFALAGNAYVALACFVVVKFTMTLHLGPIIALCFAQVPEHMRAMMSATINMFIGLAGEHVDRSEEHTSELQSLMRISYAVFCLKKKKQMTNNK